MVLSCSYCCGHDFGTYLGFTWELLGTCYAISVLRFFSRKISNGSFDLTKLRTITRTHPECNSKIKGFVCLFVPLRLLPLRYFRSIIQKKMCFSFGFCSLIRTSNPSDFRYFRSEKLKYVWFFPRLFVPLHAERIPY